MCGIFGRVSSLSPLDPERCRRQTDTLAHRGPDGAGYLVASRRSGRYFRTAGGWPQEILAAPWEVFLGHRRLAVLDLSPAAGQPLGEPGGRYWIVFNGEIYNFRELRRELQAQGAVFRTSHSDTETLLWAYIRWGEDCLARLRGMFAFAILDLKAGSLFLARDRLGKKPLYYRAGPEGLTFASELKAILADPAVPREISPLALARYLVYGYVPAPLTIYQGIRKLPAGHAVRVSLERPQELCPRRYWHPPVPEPEPPPNWQEEFWARLTEAVRLRLESDVPLGVFSSGGLDSTLVIRLMREVGGGPVHTFAVGFEPYARNELPWARLVARRYQTQHREEVVRPQAVALLPRLVHHFDEPFGDSSALPTLLLCEAARRYVTVALGGDGGDELLAGYRRYRYALALERLQKLFPGPQGEGALKVLARLWPASLRGKGLIGRAAASPGRVYRAIMAREENLALLHPEWARRAGGEGLLHEFFEAHWETGPPEPGARLQFVDLHTYLPDDLLVKTDRASMAAGLELRSPLLDHQVVEWACRLPWKLKCFRGEGKYPVKQLLLPEMGPAFVYRRKQGFQMPLGEWLRGDLMAVLRERFLARNGSWREFLRPERVQNLLARFMAGQQDLAEDLWRVLVFSEWLERVHHGRQAESQG